MSIVVYTALFGGYDKLQPVRPVPGVRFVAFTDGANVDGWECIRPPVTERTSRRENRKYKIRSHVLFPHADWTLYHDANLPLTADPQDIIADCKGGLNLYAHPWRKCAYKEATAVTGQVDARAMQAQLDRYRAAGFPTDFGLWCGGFLVRSRSADDVNDLWWQEYQSGCCRDQVCLPFVLWRLGAEFNVLQSSWGQPFYELPGGLCVRRDHIRKKNHGGTL